jgi:hypothetical protein
LVSLDGHLLALLEGGDRRSIGHVDAVMDLIRMEPHLFPNLVEGIASTDPLIAMRAADAVEKLTQERVAWLQPFKERILKEFLLIQQHEVRWHMVALLNRLDLTINERWDAVRVLAGFLHDSSKIVQAFTLQAMFDISAPVVALRQEVIAVLQDKTDDVAPAVRTRAKNLLRMSQESV